MSLPRKASVPKIGFRVPNMVISPFTRRHYLSHIPMDHTAFIKFVEAHGRRSRVRIFLHK